MARLVGMVWDESKAYFFQGSAYVRYNVAADRSDEGYQQPIGSGWPGVFDRYIDAAVMWANGKASFFRSSECVRYDVAADRVDYPQPISGWAGLNFAAPSTAAPSPATPSTTTVLPASPSTRASRYIETLFSFDLRANEAIGDCIVRCCEEALQDGPMGQGDRHEFYRDFIACNQEVSFQKADQLTHVATSCAMFVRAIRQWCGAAPVGPYVLGTPMFETMGKVSFSHPACVSHDGGSNKPNPGDYFYIASSQSNDGTAIFIEETSENAWRTAEGGGGGKTDGTLCRSTDRTIVGNKFSNDGRRRWGWFNCTRVGLPDAAEIRAVS